MVISVRAIQIHKINNRTSSRPEKYSLVKRCKASRVSAIKLNNPLLKPVNWIALIMTKMDRRKEINPNQWCVEPTAKGCNIKNG